MIKLGFFGGCFNPITIAHVKLIEELLKVKDLEKVYFVPMNNKYHKQELIDLKYRVDMIKLSIKKNPKMDILLLDESQDRRAIDTFKIIDEKFKDAKRFFIMGSDNYANINKWKNAEELLNNYNFIVLDRDDNSDTKDISSSVVRHNIKFGKDISNLVPNEIVDYIKNNKLYLS